MELSVLYRCVAALDVHQAKLMVCIMVENECGEVVSELKEFGGFKKDQLEMADWVASFQPDWVVIPKGHKWRVREFIGKARMRRSKKKV